MMFAPMNRPVSDWHGQRIWIIGASSGIGAALAQHALAAGAQVTLSARRIERLQQIASQYSNAHMLALDVSQLETLPAAYQAVCSLMGIPDLVLFCAAEYRPERSWEVHTAQAEHSLRTNLLSVYAGLEAIFPDMLQRGRGGIGLVASVAGYMGLPNASVYGPGKAAMINLAELLYADLHSKGLNVYLINPGFVSTELTAKNSFAMPALQTPQQAAQSIFKGISKGDFEIHFPQRFTRSLKLLQCLPYRLRFALFARFFN